MMHQLLEHFPALTSSPNGLKKNDFPLLDKIIHHHKSRIKIVKIDYDGRAVAGRLKEHFFISTRIARCYLLADFGLIGVYRQLTMYRVFTYHKIWTAYRRSCRSSSSKSRISVKIDPHGCLTDRTDAGHPFILRVRGRLWALRIPLGE
jgi:hypothetical protein